MSALSVNPTFPIFTDIDGQPLENGYVYVGAANLDPQGNPINVYWDAALTQLAVQPIRTRGGYPVNSGTPARLYVNSDYSIRVMNKNGSTIYSAPAATERINAALISNIDAAQVTYTPAGTGAIATTVQTRLRSYEAATGAGLIGVADAGGFYNGNTVEAVLQEILGGVPVAGALHNSRIGIVAGAIRQDSTDRTKWYYINDANHIPVGVSGAYATASGSEITITYDTTYSRVISFIAAPDETFANAIGATVGASVGLGASVVKVGANFGGGFTVEYDGTNWIITNGTGQNINPTVSSYTNGTLAITHGYCRGIGANVTPWSKNGAVINPYMPLIKNFGNGSIELQFVDTSTGNIVTSATPSTRMKAIVYKNNNTGLFVDGTNGSDYINGIDPATSANIWFFGVFEK